jgi:hypothetical protein
VQYLTTGLDQRLEFFIVSKVPSERQRANASYLALLKKYIARLIGDKILQVCLEPLNRLQPPDFSKPVVRSSQVDKELSHLGHLLSTIIPRCTDPSLVVRQTAVENVQALMCEHCAKRHTFTPRQPSLKR